MNKLCLKIAGLFNCLTAIIHIIGGQMDLINPLLLSDLNTQQIGEFVAVWHIVTIILFMTSFFLIKAGFSSTEAPDYTLLHSIGILYILIGLPFLISSIWFSIFAPQWILLIPIGLLTVYGVRSITSHG